MKEFTGTTYEEWLEYHYKVSGPALVAHCIEEFPHIMSWGIPPKKEKE